jgi:hypothetical protein
MWFYEYRHNIRENLLEKLKVIQPASEEGWDEDKIWEIESNSRHRKYSESANMACLANLVSQLNSEISPI